MNTSPTTAKGPRRQRFWLLASILAVTALAALALALVLGGNRMPRHYQDTNPTHDGPGWFSPGPARSPR